MAVYTLDFEKPLLELEKQIEELKRVAGEKAELAKNLRPLEEQLATLRTEIYRNLTPMQRVQVARHPRRPYPLDYVNTVFTDFVELHGDRLYRDDTAIGGGWARLDGITVMIVGHQKGRDTKENLYRNFGMAHPEGYRKAMRLMRLAAKFGAPVITLVDTPGAYPGLGAEERGQAEAIASSLIEMASLKTPIITAVIGEGGSGGALAVGLADRVLMLENSVYSVISPEGCAAILWKDASQRERAAEALKITAQDLLNLGVIDEIVPEPPGGAHSDPEAAAAALGDALQRHLGQLRKLKTDKLLKRREEKYLSMGALTEKGFDSRARSPVQRQPARIFQLAIRRSPPYRRPRDRRGGARSGLWRRVGGRRRGGEEMPALRLLQSRERREGHPPPGVRRRTEDRHRAARERGRRAPDRAGPRPPAQSPPEGVRRRVAVGQAQADDLFHGGAARGLPGAGAGPRGRVPHAHRAATDRRAR